MKNNNMYIIGGVVVALAIIAGVFFMAKSGGEVIPDEVVVLDAQEEVYVPPTFNEICKYEENHMELAGECEAFANNDVSLCDNLIDRNVRAWCKAKVSGDNSYCADMDPNFEDWEDCYIDTAKTREDCDSITKFNKDYERTECYAFVDKDTSLCAGPEYDRLACVGEITGDASVCDQASAFLERWDCKIAIQHNEPGICEEYHEAFCDEFYTN